MDNTKTSRRVRNSIGVLLLAAVATVGTGDLWTRNPPAPNAFIEKNYALGQADAPVTIVEFSDFQCFYCQKFTRETLPLIRKNYIDTGKVRFVFSDFPLDRIHPQARGASHAARCAGRQDKFWPYHDLLFASKLRALGPSLFEKLAERSGLDMKSYRKCMRDDAVGGEIEANLRRAVQIGVQGTPAFLIVTPTGGKLISGAYPYPTFSKILDAELKEAAARNK